MAWIQILRAGPCINMKNTKHREQRLSSPQVNASADVELRASGMTQAFIACESGLKRFISRFFYRPEDVDELAQETFLRAYVACKTTDVASPQAYLYRVAKHMALKELDRKSTRMTDYMEEAVSLESFEGGPSVEQELMAEEKLANYCKAIATLPPQCRKVFLMRKVQAKSYREIAGILGIGLSAVEKHVSKGIERFDDYMMEQDQLHQPQSRAQNNVPAVVQGKPQPVGDIPRKEPK